MDFMSAKKRFNEFMQEANRLISSGTKAEKYESFPGTGGDTTRPPQIFKKNSFVST